MLRHAFFTIIKFFNFVQATAKHYRTLNTTLANCLQRHACIERLSLFFRPSSLLFIECFWQLLLWHLQLDYYDRLVFSAAGPVDKKYRHIGPRLLTSAGAASVWAELSCGVETVWTDQVPAAVSLNNYNNWGYYFISSVSQEQSSQASLNIKWTIPSLLPKLTNRKYEYHGLIS